MQTEIIQAKNVKCGGCVNTVRTGLLALPGVQEVEVDIPSGRVTVTGEALDRARLSATLQRLGYPEERR